MMPTSLLSLCEADNAVLLVIDLQGKIFSMAFNHQRLRTMAGKVMLLADLFAVPVILTEQYPRGLGATAPELRAIFDSLETEKHVVEKEAFGCCGEPGFNERLTRVSESVQKRRGGDRARPLDIIIAGIETQVCVQQTVLELLAQGYRVIVLQDCTGSRVEEYHHIALARFRQCGAIISNLESLAFEWARTKNHPCFKRMSALIKEGA